MREFGPPFRAARLAGLPPSRPRQPTPDQQFKGALHAFQDLMRQAGTPEIIRVDLGSPFASVGLGRLSSLSVWWIEQGIAVEFTRPASPQDNGSHERMHKDLKAEATQPPSANLPAQPPPRQITRHLGQ